MTRVIATASGKGGVGKTTTTVNLGSALTQLGYDVIVVDANLTTPNIGLHLGMHDPAVTINDVIAGNTSITDAIELHDSGLRVIPASLSLSKLKHTKATKLWDILLDLFGSTDFILLDTPAGLETGAKSVLDVGEEVLIVTNPETPALTDALKTVRMAHRSGSYVIGCVLNKYMESEKMVSVEDVENMLDIPVIAKIPYDHEVRFSIQQKAPVVLRKPDSPAARAYMKLAADIAGVEYDLPAEGHKIVHLLKKWFGFD